MSLALFDLDRTLIDGYAYGSLMPELWRRKVRRTGVLRLLARLLLARAFTRKTPLSSWWPQAFAAYLGGLPAAQIANACRAAADSVRDNLRDAMRAECERHRSDGTECWLVTATVQPLAEPVARALGFEECIATRVAEDGGRFAGVLDGGVCRGAQKLSRVRARLAERGLPDDLSGASYYADGTEDLPLLAAVGRPVAVCPDAGLLAVARERGFRIVGAPR